MSHITCGGAAEQYATHRAELSSQHDHIIIIIYTFTRGIVEPHRLNVMQLFREIARDMHHCYVYDVGQIKAVSDVNWS